MFHRSKLPNPFFPCFFEILISCVSVFKINKCLLETTTAGDLKIAVVKVIEKNLAITSGRSCAIGSSTGGFDVYSVTITGKVECKTKIVCFNTWAEDCKPPVDQFARYRDAVLSTANGKLPICVVCESGCGRSGLFVLFDSESERLKSKKRIKMMDRIKTMRQQRAHSMETMDLMDAGMALVLDAAKKHKD